jgi:hypothetical protein
MSWDLIVSIIAGWALGLLLGIFLSYLIFGRRP